MAETKFEPRPSAVSAAAMFLLDAVEDKWTDHGKNTDCLMCGELNAHRPDCPVPVVEQWLRREEGR